MPASVFVAASLETILKFNKPGVKFTLKVTGSYGRNWSCTEATPIVGGGFPFTGQIGTHSEAGEVAFDWVWASDYFPNDQICFGLACTEGADSFFTSVAAPSDATGNISVTDSLTAQTAPFVIPASTSTFNQEYFVWADQLNVYVAIAKVAGALQVGFFASAFYGYATGGAGAPFGQMIFYTGDYPAPTPLFGGANETLATGSAGTLYGVQINYALMTLNAPVNCAEYEGGGALGSGAETLSIDAPTITDHG